METGEWKGFSEVAVGDRSPHSLGILIEWKLSPYAELCADFLSPLAGDIN